MDESKLFHHMMEILNILQYNPIKMEIKESLIVHYSERSKNCVNNYYSPQTGKCVKSEPITKEFYSGGSYKCRHPSPQSPNDFYIGCGDGMIFRKSRSGEFKKYQKIHQKQVYSMDVLRRKSSGKKELMLSGCYEGKVVLWNAESNEMVKEFRVHSNCVSSCRFLEPFGEFATGSYGKELKFHDMVKMVQVGEKIMLSGLVRDLVFFEEKGALICCSQGKDIQVLDLKSKKMEQKVQHKQMSSQFSAYLILGNCLLAGDLGGWLHSFDIRKLKDKIYEEKVHKSQLWRIIKYKNDAVITGSWDNTIKVVNASKAKVLMEIQTGLGVYGQFLLKDEEENEMSMRDFDERSEYLSDQNDWKNFSIAMSEKKVEAFKFILNL